MMRKHHTTVSEISILHTELLQKGMAHSAELINCVNHAQAPLRYAPGIGKEYIWVRPSRGHLGRWIGKCFERNEAFRRADELCG